MGSPERSSTSASAIGAVVSKYQLKRRLGEGAMGVVFEAEDTKLRRTVALKLLHPRVAEEPDRRKRFLREGRLAAHLNHPCIATVYEAGEAEGRIFIAMELVKGDILARIIEKSPQGMPWIDAVRIFREIARGLRKAHEAGIIHRDLKPDNIMVGEEGIVKILDFGVAKPTETFDIQFTDVKTHSGSLVGTPAYMSPEQAAGRDVDLRSDIFSIGVLLYEMLTGRRPFVRETWQELIIAINRDEITPVSVARPDVPGEVDALIARCMAKKPEDRYASCREVVDETERLLGGSSPVATLVTTSPPTASPVELRKPRWPIAVGLGVGVVVALAVVLAIRAEETAPLRQPAVETAPPVETAAPAGGSATAEPPAGPASPTATVTAEPSATATAKGTAGPATAAGPPPPPPPPRKKNPVLGF
jgi:serine/threonine-protein kinase